MADDKYLANRLKYHTASRIATQTGEALAQALNVDGHIVTSNKVWAAPQSAFINNVNKSNTDSFDATTDLVAAFKVGATSTTFWNGGVVWTNTAYPAVKLYENVKMTKVTGSDGGAKYQAFEILADPTDGVSSGNVRIVDWIAPTAVADRTTGKPVAGYSGIPMYNGTALKVAKTQWAEAEGSYEFAYMAGLLTFKPGCTPQDFYGNSAVDNITITAFKYIGKYEDEVIAGIEAQLGGATPSGSNPLSERVAELEGTVAGYNSVNTIHSAIAAETSAREDAFDNLSETLAGYTPEHPVSAAIESLRESAATYALSAIGENGGNAASYKLLQTVDGVQTEVGTINIPKDQFLSDALYDKDTEELVLVFSLEHENGEITSGNVVRIPVDDMVHEYVAGNGIDIDDQTEGGSTVSIKLNTSINENGFLVVTADGLALTGVQTAIEEVAGDALAGLETLSTAIGEYVSGNAVPNKFSEVDLRLDSAETRLDVEEEILAGFNGQNAISTRFVVDEAEIADVKNKAASGITATQTITGAVVSNMASLDVKISETDGNAITVDGTGLFVQSYKAGTNITFGTAEDGVIPINADYTYTLSAATTTELGGILAGSYISVDSEGNAVVKKVENALTVFGSQYDGSAALTVQTSGEYLTTTTDNGTISIAAVVTGAIEENNTGLIKGGQVYNAVEILSNAIDDAKDALSGQVSAAFEEDEVVIGTSGGITASGYKIGTDDSGTAFGAASTVASEARVESYVNDGLEDLFNAVSGFNAEFA